MPALIAKAEFIADLAAAIASGRGFAAGKLGHSEKQWMYQPVIRAQTQDVRLIRAYELTLGYHGEIQSGVFPRDTDFYARFNEAYAPHIHNLDCIGLVGAWNERALIDHYGLTAKMMNYVDQEPDRSVPYSASACYLPHFQGKRLLIVSPFAPLLKERAIKATFEAVWAKTGKPWFDPAAVEALPVPYGWSKKVQARYATSLELYAALAEQMDRIAFDVALIGAGGLGIPLASHAKSLGKAAISLGGHLQIVFGVLGARWRSRPDWQRDYFNAAWIDPPAEYHPDDPIAADRGAYW